MFKMTILLQSGIFCILADALMKSEIYSDYVQVCIYLQGFFNLWRSKEKELFFPLSLLLSNIFLVQISLRRLDNL